MDKLLLFALGITCLTLVLLYVFMKNRFEFYDNKIDLLFNVYQKLAMDIQSSQHPTDTKSVDILCSEGMCRTLPIMVSSDDVESDSEDSCSVNTEESEEETYEPMMDKIIILKHEEPEFDTRSVEEIVINKLDEPVEEVEQVDQVESIEEPEKKMYSKLTVKELKQLVADVHGPSSLKTKQEMIHYLENN